MDEICKFHPQCVAPLPCPLTKPLDHFQGAVDGGCISFATGCILFAFSVSSITKTRQKRSPLIEKNISVSNMIEGLIDLKDLNLNFLFMNIIETNTA